MRISRVHQRACVLPDLQCVVTAETDEEDVMDMRCAVWGVWMHERRHLPPFDASSLLDTRPLARQPLDAPERRRLKSPPSASIITWLIAHRACPVARQRCTATTLLPPSAPPLATPCTRCYESWRMPAPWIIFLHFKHRECEAWAMARRLTRHSCIVRRARGLGA